ncbi:MAG: FHA domain-containing protein [Lachnospiraceae bacterium]|nr:FHA domain-containing protein [Lachnospiraceae bacterium]
MEVIYKRERGHNYILFPGEEEAGTQTEMIRRNQIPGVAVFYTEWEDNRRYYGYDITGAKPLNRILEVRPLTGKEAEGMIGALAGLLQRMEPFLLDRDKLVLKPELLYVYTDRQGLIRSGREGIAFFFCEEQEGSYGEHLRELVLYLFEKADEENRGLTELLFRLYRVCAGREPEAEELLTCLKPLFRFPEKREETSNPAEKLYSEVRYDGKTEMGEGRKAGGKRNGTGKRGIGKSERFREEGRLKESGGFWAGKKDFLAKILGKKPVSMEEMWDDLEPLRKKEQEMTEGRERKPEWDGKGVIWNRNRTEWDKGNAGWSERNAEWNGEEWDGKKGEKIESVSERVGKEMDNLTEILYIVEEEGCIPALIEQESGKKILLERFPFYIGTQPGLDYCPDFHGVSRIHLKLDKCKGDIWITDLNSTNGTGIDGETLRPNEERRLKHGDEIWLAGLIYKFDSGRKS